MSKRVKRHILLDINVDFIEEIRLTKVVTQGDRSQTIMSGSASNGNGVVKSEWLSELFRNEIQSGLQIHSQELKKMVEATIKHELVALNLGNKTESVEVSQKTHIIRNTRLIRKGRSHISPPRSGCHRRS
jgi:hypothetical protein